MIRFLKFFSVFIILNSLFIILPERAYAHAFGQQYNLPVPFSLYATGAALAIIASFVLIGVFSQAQGGEEYPQIDISNFFLIRFLKNKTVTLVIKLASFLLLLISIITGLFGTLNPIANFNMTYFWIIFVLGLTYSTAIFGNIYQMLNPWRFLVELSQKISGRTKPFFNYPSKLGYYPACIFYFLFIWIELFGKVTPFQLSILLINYSILSVVGAFIFGKEVWLGYFDFFGVFYSLLSKLSFIKNENGKTYLRPPFVGLISANFRNTTLVPFVIFMLSSTAFDGFKETINWYTVFFAVYSYFAQSAWFAVILNTLGLLLTFAVFYAIYRLLTFTLKLISGEQKNIGELLLYFAPSLIPIALAYNVAHYYTLFAIAGQQMISLTSDPLGKGWNLFGTANFVPNIALIDVKTVWHSQVAIILVGHIAAVYIAHILSLNLFKDTKKALIAQLPTLVLMICYTIAGLWILAQSLTSGF